MFLVCYIGRQFLEHIVDEHGTCNLQFKLNGMLWNTFSHLHKVYSIHEGPIYKSSEKHDPSIPEKKSI